MTTWARSYHNCSDTLAHVECNATQDLHCNVIIWHSDVDSKSNQNSDAIRYCFMSEYMALIIFVTSGIPKVIFDTLGIPKVSKCSPPSVDICIFYTVSLLTERSWSFSWETLFEADVTFLTSIRQFSLLLMILVHSCKGSPTAPLIWSVHGRLSAWSRAFFFAMHDKSFDWVVLAPGDVAEEFEDVTLHQRR